MGTRGRSRESRYSQQQLAQQSCYYFALDDNYTGPDTARLREALRARADEVRANLIGVDGLVSYFIIDTGGGGGSVTLCGDRAGCEESLRVARTWLDEHVPGVSGQVVVTEGPVDLHVG